MFCYLPNRDNLQVMFYLRLHKIPERHILKRWTVDARDILPDHIKHYQKDMGPPEASTFRHSAMYITALELVHMGDSNPDAFECVMSGLCELKDKTAGLSLLKDGKSVVEKSIEASASNTNTVDTRPSRLSSKQPSKKANSRTTASDKSDGISSVRGVGRMVRDDDGLEVSSAPLAGDVLMPPERRLKRGQPSTARDKAPYETTGKRSRFCSICRGKGHKSTTCPNRGDMPVKPRKEAKCSSCGLTGHRKTSCSKPLFSTIVEVAEMTA